MTITQRFYPKAIETVFRQGNIFLFNEDNVNSAAIGMFFLLRTNSGIEWDPERSIVAESLLDVVELLAKTSYSKSGVVTCQRQGTKLKFLIPDLRWDTPVDSAFRHGLLCVAKAEGGGAFKVYSLLHIDFGEDLNPQTGFEFKQNSNCMPHIEFEPIACTGAPTPPAEYTYSGAKVDVKSGDFSLVEISSPSELSWDGTINQTLMGEFTIEGVV